MRHYIRGLLAGIALFVVFLTGAFAETATAEPTVQFCDARDGLVGAEVIKGAVEFGVKVIPIAPKLNAGFLAKLKIELKEKPYAVIIFFNDKSEDGKVGAFDKDGCTIGKASFGPYKFEELRDALLAARSKH